MTTLKRQVQRAVESCGDNAQTMVCMYHPRVEDQGIFSRDAFSEAVVRCTFDELPEREYDADFGTPEGEPFIGFTERFVYVRGIYDGSEWIQPIPRAPEFVTAIPSVGE